MLRSIRNTAGYFNNGHGNTALFNNRLGNQNNAMGDRALRACTGSFNTAMGDDSLSLLRRALTVTWLLVTTPGMLSLPAITLS